MSGIQLKNKEMNRREEMKWQFEAFHYAHPRVWELFKKFTWERISRGFLHYSSKGIFERIRWETAVAETGKQEFKLNNNFSAFYARTFMRIYPEYEGFFRTRKQISEDDEATCLAQLTPQDF